MKSGLELIQLTVSVIPNWKAGRNIVKYCFAVKTCDTQGQLSCFYENN
jgi:hypothetical protein